MGERLLLRCTGSIYRRNLCSLRGLDGWRRDDVEVKGVGMLNSRKPFLLVALAVSMSVPTSVRAEPKAFLGQFCVQCHGEKKPKANLSLHNLTDTPVKRSEIDTWKHVLDKIETGEMPPEGSKQPDSDQRQKMVAAIKGMLKNAGVSLDEARWLAPSRGNWVDHDALFSGKPVDPAATKPRLWRLSGQAYEEFMRQKNLQFKLGIKTYGQGKIRAPWELGAQKEFSDYASSQRMSEQTSRQRRLNLTLAAGFVLKVKAGGWKLLCERLSVPPFVVWKGLPGFDRLERARALAEQAAFMPAGMVHWLNDVRPAGTPALSRVPLTVEGIADALVVRYRRNFGPVAGKAVVVGWRALEVGLVHFSQVLSAKAASFFTMTGSSLHALISSMAAAVHFSTSSRGYSLGLSLSALSIDSEGTWTSSRCLVSALVMARLLLNSTQLSASGVPGLLIGTSFALLCLKPRSSHRTLSTIGLSEVKSGHHASKKDCRRKRDRPQLPRASGSVRGPG